MALIYANAVNKRMHHGSRVKKRSAHSCPLHDDLTESSDYRRSASRDTPIRKYSENSSYWSSSTSSCHSLSPSVNKSDIKHRPVQRSKTSCEDFYLKKIVEDDIMRKTSHQVVSLTKDKHCDEIRKLSKKSLCEKCDLIRKTSSRETKLDRRKSVSLDDEQWRKVEKKDDNGAFTKMKRKFSKLMFN